MDYLIFKALNFNMGGIEAALICYDVMCQWSVHVKDRVTGSRHLKIRQAWSSDWVLVFSISMGTRIPALLGIRPASLKVADKSMARRLKRFGLR
jgi:hypothetical protein